MMKNNQRDKRKPENYIVTESKEESFLSFSKAAERKKENEIRKRLLEFFSFPLICKCYDAIMKNNSF